MAAQQNWSRAQSSQHSCARGLRLSTKERPQPLIVFNDVPASSRWYQVVLGRSAHGGEDDQNEGDGATSPHRQRYISRDRQRTGSPNSNPRDHLS